MTQETEAVLKQAMTLGPVDRAELIEALFRSFDRQEADRVDVEWAQEAEARIDAFDSGAVTADSADAIIARIGAL